MIVIWGLILINILVHLLWNKSSKAMKDFMYDHFSLDSRIAKYKYYTLLTHGISHIKFSHLLTNNLGLLLAIPLEDRLVLGLFIWGTFVGSITYLLHRNYFSSRIRKKVIVGKVLIIVRKYDECLVGSSGGVMSILTFLSWIEDLNGSPLIYYLMTIILVRDIIMYLTDDIIILLYRMFHRDREYIFRLGHIVSILSTVALTSLLLNKNDFISDNHVYSPT